MRGFLLLLLSFVTIVTYSQSHKNESLFVYRNDGGFDAFFQTDIDSITYSHIGADSLYHADYQMQLVHTTDSIYRIPLSVIDSVSLVKPEPVLNADVFLLTAAHDPYLMDADTLLFTLKAGAPASMCPKKGNVVVSAYDCKAFPHGIMARVLSVNCAIDGSQRYVCGKASLEDIYDRLVVYEKCAIDEAWQAAARRKAMEQIDTSRDFTLWDSDFEQEITASGTTTNISAHDAATATITIKLVRGQSSYFRFDLRNDFKSSVSFNANSTACIEKEWQLGRTLMLPRIAIPGTVFWLTPRFSLYGYLSEQGEVNLDFGAHLNRSDMFSLICENGKWSHDYKPKTSAGLDVASLSMRGSVEVGLRPDIQFGLCGSATGFGFVYRVGLKESVDFKFDALEYVQNGGTYAALRDSYARTTIPQSVNAYAHIGLFGPSMRWDMPTFKMEPQWGSDKYMLPLFGETAATIGKDYRSVVLQTDVSRDLLLPVELGYSVFDKDENLVGRKYLDIKYLNSNEWPFNGVETYFTELESCKTYTAYPTVRIMTMEMTAIPSKEFEIEDDISYNTTCPNNQHPHMIDLGLPSGIKWACCNVGASNPSDYGNYFSWGEISPKGKYTDCITWEKDMRDIAGNPSFDAACANWGVPWRMPTLSDLKELHDKCKWTWIGENECYGYSVQGPNGNSIFLPAAGWRFGTALHSAGKEGRYWSSTPCDSYYYAKEYYFGYYSSDWSIGGACSRIDGLSVRPISK